MRPKASHRWGRGRRIVLYSTILMVLAALYAFYRSAYFRVEVVEVAGTQQLQAGEVIEATGILLGTSLLGVRPSKVKALVEALPYVKEARVMVRLPSRVTVSVTERSCVGYLLVDRSYLAIDEEGVLLERWEGAFFLDQPLVTGDIPGDMLPGERLTGTTLLDAARLLGLLGDFRDEVSEVNASAEGLTLYTIQGLPVYMGSPGALMEEKVAILKGILEDAKREGLDLEYVDIRTSKPVVRPKEGTYVPRFEEFIEEGDDGASW
ncbi:MAG: FtsQ-type POTRA domain-containing protein [Bacillota bacterium]